MNNTAEMKKLNFVDSMIIYLYSWYKQLRKKTVVYPESGKMFAMALFLIPIYFCLWIYFSLHNNQHILKDIDRRVQLIIILIIYFIFSLITIKNKDIVRYEKNEQVCTRGKKYCIYLLYVDIISIVISLFFLIFN